MSQSPFEPTATAGSAMLLAALPSATDRAGLLRALEALLQELEPSALQVVWRRDGQPWSLLNHQPELAAPPAEALPHLAAGQVVVAHRLSYLPLIALGELRGWIALQDAREPAAALDIAAQAGMALALLERQPVAGMDRELAVMDQIGRMLSSTLELDQLLPRLGAIARELVPADSFYIALLDHTTDELYFAYLSDDLWEPLPSARWRSDSGLTGQIVRTGTAILTDDYLAECARRQIPPQRPVNIEYSHAWLGVPLRHHDQVLGVMVASMRDPNVRYTRSDLHLLSSVAAQAAAAVANAQLYWRVEQQARQLATINRIFRAISGTLDPQEVPSRIMSELREALQVADGALLVEHQATGELQVRYTMTGARHQLPAAGIGLAREALRRQTVLFQNQLPGDTAGRDALDDAVPSLLCAPLIGRQQLRGAILLVNSRNTGFTTADTRLLEAVAEQAAIALENAELYANTDSALAAHIADLEQRNQQLNNLLAISNALRTTNNLYEVGQQIVATIQKITGSPRIAVGLVDLDYQAVTPLAQTGFTASQLAGGSERGTPLDQVQAMLYTAERIGSVTYHVGQHPITSAFFHDCLALSLLDADGAPVGMIGLELSGAAQPLRTTLLHELEIIANQAAIAIISARRATEQQQMLDRLTALNGLGLAVTTAQLSTDEILQMTVRGAMGTTNGIGGGWRVRARDDSWRRFVVGLPATSDAVLTPWLERTDSDYWELREAQLDDSLRALGMRSVLVVPVRGAKLILGTLWIGYGDPLVAPAEREMVVLYAKTAGGVLENLRLFDQVSSAHDRLASILASTEEGMALASADGRITTANMSLARLLNLPTESLEGRTIAQLCDSLKDHGNPDAFEQVCHALQAVARGASEEQTGEITLATPEERSLAWSVRPVHSATGHTNAALLVLRDISAERRTEKLRQDLTNMIVHDLRAPLTNMMVSTDLLLKQISGPLTAAQQRILQIAADSSQQMLDLVNALLDIRRLEQHQLELQRQPLELDAIVATVLERLSRIAAERNIAFVNTNASWPTVHGDPDLIRRVLQNLIDNAIKFSPRGGAITISGTIDDAGRLPVEHAPGHYLVIAVMDQGQGVPEAYRDVIFELFGQAPHGRGQGTGLGLAFCRLAVEAHGGRVWVEDNPAGGALFRFTLPLT